MTEMTSIRAYFGSHQAALISSAFQAPEPMVVKSENCKTGISDKPAGIEATLRASDTILPKSTTQRPYLPVESTVGTVEVGLLHA